MHHFLLILSLALALLPSLGKTDGCRYGTKIDVCRKSLADAKPSIRILTDSVVGDSAKISYSPARCLSMDWDFAVMDFYKGKFYGESYLASSAVNDSAAFNAVKFHLTNSFGEPLRVDTGSKSVRLLWQDSKANLAVLQYYREKDKNGLDKFVTHLYFSKSPRGKRNYQEFMRNEISISVGAGVLF
jgi:hypothetical protein